MGLRTHLNTNAQGLVTIMLVTGTMFLGLTVWPQGSEAGPTEGSVQLISKLNDSVTVHCWSRETDLGSFILYPGQHHYWSFRPSILGRTVFMCNFMWDKEKQEFAVWKGSYHADRLPCCSRGPCSFLICNDGFYNALMVDTDDYEPAESWCYYLGWNPNPG